MDRLICGDVGFGKTEVAIRAAMKVVTSGRQVLMLVPTTILAQQHVQTLPRPLPRLPGARRGRLAHPRGRRGQGRRCARSREGKVDILIGTHRVLSRDVVPKDLGLVIVDEEQRFGVAQKELLRQLRPEVDVLALSATPIPRSLHMSLPGLRDISVIATPPRGRRPIRTHVGEYDEELVRAACCASTSAAGSRSTCTTGSRRSTRRPSGCASSCPSCASPSATGRWRSAQLEQVMEGFLRGDQEVLVRDDDHRVGPRHPAGQHAHHRARRHARAVAAVPDPRARRPLRRPRPRVPLLPRRRASSREEARARLAALADYTELGSGYRIAMRDLELRGAGNLLGDEQSGHVAAIGFELYCELLAEAVAELQGDRGALSGRSACDRRAGRRVRAGRLRRLEAAKIDVHRRIALSETVDELRDIEVELADRFGELAGAGREPHPGPGGAPQAGRARRRLADGAGGAGDGRAHCARAGRPARAARAPRPPALQLRRGRARAAPRSGAPADAGDRPRGLARRPRQPRSGAG